MKKILSVIAIAFVSIVVSFAQSVTLTFTAKDVNNFYVRLNRVAITNLTKSWQETIFWPDTVLIMQNGTGIDEHQAKNDKLVLAQNNPNPFYGTTDVSLTVAEEGALQLEISDINGRVVEIWRTTFVESGVHQFRVNLSSPGTYVMTARQNGLASAIKMVCNGGGGANAIDYLGIEQTITVVLKSSTDNPFNYGDMMEYVGYATINGEELESLHITQAQGSSQTFTLRFDVAQHQLPVVTTTEASDITMNSASCGGNVTSDGGAAVTARGVCWSTSQNPTVSGSHTTDGSGTGGFTSSLTGLTAGTTYYVRAYATNSVGTAYGSELSFTTAVQLPTVTTAAVSSITETSAICGGDVTNNGGANVTARGVCWSTSQNPTVSDSHTTDGSGTGSFTSSLTGLTSNTTYYVRAYATSSVGTAYGNELSFTTISQLPTVTTTTVSSITDSTAICGGNVTSAGDAVITARGVCWSISQNPTVGDSHTTDGSGTGSFISNVTALTPNTTYYIRAYATSSLGTVYGNELSFTTTGPFICGTSTLSDYDGNMYNTVQIGGQCWMRENLRTTHYANGESVPTGSASSYDSPYYYNYSSSSIPLAQRGYLYNWPAVMNGASSSYSNPSGVQGICPDDWHVPSVAEWLQLANYVSSQSQYLCNNNSSYVAKALCSTTGWNSSSYTCAVGNTPENNNATGFTIYPTGRYDGSSYENSGWYANFWTATEYSGSEACHRWLGYKYADLDSDSYNYKNYGHSVRCIRNTLPTVTTTMASNITDTTAICGGNVTSDAGNAIIARGVCWSTSHNPTLNDNHTIEGSGLGSFTSSLTGLTASTMYYVRAYATNNVGTAYGNEVSFATTGPFACGIGVISDYDGNLYNTVQIGDQCWTRENLRTTHYANGTSILAGNTSSSSIPYYYDYSSSALSLEQRGYLYNWPAVMNGASSSNTNPSHVQGVCPDDWHVPSHAEWTQLTDYLSSHSQYVCTYYDDDDNETFIASALASTTGWNSYVTDCSVGYFPSSNNKTGFTAYPAGYYYNGGYIGSGNYTSFWCATESSTSSGQAYIREIYYNHAFVGPSVENKDFGFSVRCVRNELPKLSDLTITAVADTTAVASCTVTDDGGSAVTVRGVCWSTSHNPTINDNHTVDGTGVGSFTSSLTGLDNNTVYYVRAYATNVWGTTYSTEIRITTSFKCGSSELIDIDGNVYNTIMIGNQCWMKENLRVTRYADGSPLTPGSSYYPLQADNAYGYLYTWYAAMKYAPSSQSNPSGVQGVCPDGWHLPSSAEWDELVQYVTTANPSQYLCNYNSSNIAKALASTNGWNSSTTTCAVGNTQENNNATGFSALPAGDYDGGYSYYGSRARFWSTTQYSNGSAYYRGLQSSAATLSNTYESKSIGNSVRCICDMVGTSVLPTLSSLTVTSITDSSAGTACSVIDNGGSPVTARGVCWSTSHNPTTNDNHTTDGTGTGSFTSTFTGSFTDTTYYVRAYAVNSSGTAYGREISIAKPTPFMCGTETITDVDGNVYNTLRIGNQCWMKENLRTTKYSNGAPISTQHAIYGHENYGRLYDWVSIMGGHVTSSTNPSNVQGVCPAGWHVPSDSEWIQSVQYLTSESQYLCDNINRNIAKSLASTTDWTTSSGTCDVGNMQENNNATGFNAFPTGYYTGYSLQYYYNRAYFWSTTAADNYDAYVYVLEYCSPELKQYAFDKDYGFSVRCVRDLDDRTVSLPSLSTLEIMSIADTTAVLNCNVTDDGGLSVTARGICWSTSPNPSINDNYTVASADTGFFSVTLTGLTAYTTYYVRAYATNSAGTAYSAERAFTTSFVCGIDSVIDIEGNAYGTVQIGNQCWMRDNLRTTTYANGASIAYGTSTSTTEAYYYNYTSNGMLYNWMAVMGGDASATSNPSGVRGVCPGGWHVPSDAEWTQLTNYVNNQSEYLCGNQSNRIAKALATTTGWNSSTTTCAVGNTQENNNATGFSVFPAGYYHGSNNYIGSFAAFWSATEYSSSKSYYRDLEYNKANVIAGNVDKYFALSVRCLRD